MGKKSYKGFVLSLIAYLALVFGVAFIPAEDFDLPMRLVMLATVWYTAALAFYIWRTERVYLYNGTSYEEAEAAGPERRKEFAWRHFRLFGIFALIQTVVTCASWLLGWSSWIDFTVAVAGIVAACFMTIPIKL